MWWSPHLTMTQSMINSCSVILVPNLRMIKYRPQLEETCHTLFFFFSPCSRQCKSASYTPEWHGRENHVYIEEKITNIHDNCISSNSKYGQMDESEMFNHLLLDQWCVRWRWHLFRTRVWINHDNSQKIKKS